MPEVSIFGTLLSSLEKAEYNNLIKLEELHAEGYSFHYTIDTDVIHNYCFPRGFEGSVRSTKIQEGVLTTDYINDEQITLHLFINKEEKSYNIFFFDQYIRELNGLINTANINSKKHKGFSDNLFKNDIEHEKVDKDYLREDLFKLIASVLLNMNGLQKFKQIFRDKKILLENSSHSSTFLDDIPFGKEVSKQNVTAISLLYKDYFKKFNAFYNEASKERDAIVIERILNINNHSIAANKKIILLVTDSYSTRVIFEKVKENLSIAYPSANNKKITFCITTNELFAYLICKGESRKEADHKEVIENLEQLQSAMSEMNRELNKTRRALGEKTVDALMHRHPVVFENLKNIRKAYENSGLLKSFDTIYKSLQSELEKKELLDIKIFLKEKIDNQGSLVKEVIQEQGEMLMNLKDEIDFNTGYLQSILEIKRNNKFFDLSPGSDSIKASYQHLPLLFKFLTIDSATEYYESMLALTNLVLNRDINRSKLLVDQLEKLLKQLLDSKPKFSLEEKIIKAFIFLLLPPSSNQIEEGKDKTDLFALKWLEKILSSYPELGDFESDVWYMYCWAARRNLEYKTANRFAQKGIEKYPQDPRFYHGKALVNYCIYESNINKSIGDLDAILNDFHISYDLYPNFIMNYYNYGDNEALIDKMNDCLNNSFCFLLSEKAYKLNDNKQHEYAKAIISEARKYLQKLKTNGAYHEDLPEYFGTEANLEYLESEYERGQNRIEKLIYASKAIERAVLLSTNESKSTYEERKIKIFNRLAVSSGK